MGDPEAVHPTRPVRVGDRPAARLDFRGGGRRPGPRDCAVRIRDRRAYFVVGQALSTGFDSDCGDFETILGSFRLQLDCPRQRIYLTDEQRMVMELTGHRPREDRPGRRPPRRDRDLSRGSDAPPRPARADGNLGPRGLRGHPDGRPGRRARRRGGRLGVRGDGDQLGRDGAGRPPDRAGRHRGAEAPLPAAPRGRRILGGLLAVRAGGGVGRRLPPDRGRPAGRPLRAERHQALVLERLQAGVITLFATVDPKKGAKGITAFLVEPGSPASRWASRSGSSGSARRRR